jgi:predicted DNA-binding transcriptional regulator YafY
MGRSTKADKARQLNAAHQLLERHMELSEAAQNLAREFELSLRQAYRYLEEPAQLEQPVEIAEATIPIP